jgi:hypothetical protein
LHGFLIAVGEDETGAEGRSSDGSIKVIVTRASFFFRNEFLR